MSEKKVSFDKRYDLKFHRILNLKRDKKCLAFLDTKRLSCMDVNLSVIDKFKSCGNLKEYKDFEDVKKTFEEIDFEEDGRDCIDLLGVYIAPLVTDDGNLLDKGNILLSKEKISEVARKIGIDTEALYYFVKTHEYAHAIMCPKLLAHDIEEKYKKFTALYVMIEEALATAIALKYFKSSDVYNELYKFVQQQPPQYRAGLYIVDNFFEYVEDLMCRWKIAKSSGDISSSFKQRKNSQEYEKFLGKIYKLTQDEIFLPNEVRDIFIF